MFIYKKNIVNTLLKSYKELPERSRQYHYRSWKYSLWKFGSMKCPVYEMSGLWNVWSMKCPVYEMSGLWNVRSMNCTSMKCPSMKCPNAHQALHFLRTPILFWLWIRMSKIVRINPQDPYGYAYVISITKFLKYSLSTNLR